MATINKVLDQRAGRMTKGGAFPYVFRLSHHSKTRDIGLKLSLKPEQIDLDTGNIIGIVNAVRYSKTINKLYADIDDWLFTERAIIKNWDVDRLKATIEKRFFNKQDSTNLLVHAANYFARLCMEDRASTASSYEDAVKVFVKYRMKKKNLNDKVIIRSLFNKDFSDLTNVKFDVLTKFTPFDMAIKAIDIDFLKGFRAYMIARFPAVNTVNMHMRSLSAIFTDAGSSYQDIKDHKPFTNFEMASIGNAPNPLTLEELHSIINLDLTSDQELSDAREVMFFMIKNMGMNFYDMALLKVKDFDGVRISYFRKKTEKTEEGGDFFSIIQDADNLRLLHKQLHGKLADDYIFPYLSKETPRHELFTTKNNALFSINRQFEKLRKLAKIKTSITTYTLRDTWTNIGIELKIESRLMSDGLGHSELDTINKHYVKPVAIKTLDDVNQRIIEVIPNMSNNRFPRV